MPIRSHEDPALDGLEALRPVHGAEWAVEVDVEPWLFGGGVKPREGDPVQALRPPSILGHLRFFFRLLADAANVADLRVQESAIFGAASTPAPFRIDVRTLAEGRARSMKDLVPKMWDPLGYVAFPAREQRNPYVRAADLLEGARARVILRGSLDPKLIAAAKLWTLLGGIGGRTRRGLGAVQTNAWGEGMSAFDSTLLALLDGTPRVPKCGGDVRSIAAVWRSAATFPTATQCLGELERWYKGYRQHRRPGSDRPGRSYWDEPEHIRNKTGARCSRHPPLPLPQGTHASGWARSVLGLPIGFRFHPDSTGDPPPSILMGTGIIDRMASPLLFRPVRVEPRKYVAVAVQLSEPYLPPGGLGLKYGSEHPSVPSPPDPARVWTDLFTQSGSLALQKIV